MRSRKRGCAAGACRCQSALSQLGKPVGEQISTALQAAMKDFAMHTPQTGKAMTMSSHLWRT